MKPILIASMFLIAHVALAQSNAVEQIRKCSSYTNPFELAPTGTVCMTSKGGKFKRISKGIQELESGLIIMTHTRDKVSHSAATNYCKQKGKRLPTIEEYIALNERGFQETLSYDVTDKILWTSSTDSRGGKDFAIVFHERIAPVRAYWVDTGEYLDTGKDREDSVRCVSLNSAKNIRVK